MGNPVYFTLGQAAREVGKSKGTLSKYIKLGKLSYVKKDGNQYQIDPAELFRVFPKKKRETAQNERMETPANTNVNSGLEREIELLNERLKEKDETIDDLRQRLDRTDAERQKVQTQLTALLTDQSQNDAEKRYPKLEAVVAVVLILAIGFLVFQYWPVLIR